MTGPTYLHIYEEQVIDGPKGLSFKLYKRDGDKKEKIVGKRNESGTFTVIYIKGDKKDTETYTLEELKKEVKKNKELDFVTKYISTAKIARTSRRLSRASSKRRSRGAKKVTSKRRTSRKTSRKGSKKGSRKAKKTSRKTSRRRRSRR